MSRFAARLGTGVALAAALALSGAPTVALAAEPLPDLSTSFDRDPVAEVDNSGTTVGLYVYNNGGAASGVTVTFDLRDLGDAVTASIPEWTEGCKLGKAALTCTVGHLDAGQTVHVQPLGLTSRQGARPGDAGSVTFSVASAEEDANPEDNTTSFPVTVIASGPDLVASAADLNTKADRVGPGDTRPLYTAVTNEGDTAATDFAIRAIVPTGATFVERYRDCTYRDYYPDDSGGDYVYGPGEVTCVVPLALEPGTSLLLFDEQSGESLFNVRFGRNLPGPEQHVGSFDVALAEEVRAARTGKRGAGGGPSFADTIRKQQKKATPAGADRRKAALGELDEGDNYADYSVWSKKNTLDVAVTASAVRGAVGETVDLTYEVVNKGPSDGGGPSVVITAPSGTVLLPAEWCYTDGTEHASLPESAKLRCNFESEFPALASGYGRIKATVRLRIKSPPGTDGTIVARSVAVASAETTPANNTARIVVTTGGSGGTGGGLPVTGAPTGALAVAGAAVLALGAVLLVLARRRRVVLQAPRD
ncbi:LPXTG cell wall anchor domain-containing protein [Jidongwangia harbinensis]|uniref:LPXTG cell wall anchor domain-containing protein n=1 Tax=Jidongwangia harbinensis TaxID=2878561 RepID=UPI001CD94F47|nr:LPXTG cell wall anchor domain-containing protein [Jidongwangia harbinensis]MCA2219284.1 LPXTG cell wall anchor domain-containing protein [Jidongwangia harbinensis]